jgi:hypothetical protein
MRVQAAFAGTFRAGSWVPVFIELRNDGPDRAIEVRAQTNTSASYAARLDLPNNATKAVTLYVATPTQTPRLVVQLFLDGVQVERQTIRLQPFSGDTQVVGVISADGAIRRMPNAGPNGNPVRSVGLTLADMPDNALGLSLFTSLVIDDVSTEGLSQPQQDALEGWIARGGQLIIGGGVNGSKVLAGLPETLQIVQFGAGADRPARDFFGPTAPESTVRLASLVPTTDSSVRPVPYVRPLTSLPNRVDQPLIYEQTIGKGAVTVVGLPLNGPAFNGWPEQMQFWQEVLWQPDLLPPGFAPNTFTVDGLIEGNLAAALTSLPALEFPSLTVLGSLLLAYILLVGPGTYLLLRRFDRLALGWVIVPLITLVFVGLSYGIGYAQRGGEVLFNQVNLVEPFDGGNSGLARRRSLLGVFSPTQSQYEIDIHDREGETIPLVRPISVQGPWDANVSNQGGIFVQEQDNPPLDSARASELLIPQWSLRGMLVDTIGPYAGIRSTVTISGTELSGEVENRSNQRLEDVTIVQGDRLVNLGVLEPGERRSGLLRRPPNNNGVNNLSAPLSYLIYREQIDSGNQPNKGPIAPAVQARIRLIDTVFSYGPNPRSGQPVVLAWGKSMGVEAELLGERADSQSVELITFAPQVRVADETAELGQGWLNKQFASGQEGVCFGNLGVGVNLLERPVLLNMALPRTLYGFAPESITLVTAADGPWPPGVVFEIYDWQQQAWVEQVVGRGNTTLSEPERFLGSHGKMQVRLSRAPDNFGTGCLYVDATLKGTLP